MTWERRMKFSQGHTSERFAAASSSGSTKGDIAEREDKRFGAK